MSEPKFEEGTITKKTVAQFNEIARVGIKAVLHTDVAEIRPVFDLQGDSSIIGYELVHAIPAPRAPRADKGVARGPKGAPKTPPKPDWERLSWP